MLSTDHHLLNPARQFQTGAVTLLCCDCTYKLAHDRGQGLMIISTNCIGQHCHIIAWGLINHEDTEVHERLFRQARDAVHQVTKARADAGDMI
eukprot:2574778-Rhodomonas_salina.1